MDRERQCINGIYLFFNRSITHTNGYKASTKDRTYYENAGDVIWEVDTEEKMVALTFDDDPNPAYTSRILDILNAYNAKGTFFVLGSMVQKHPGLVYRQFLEGHEVGTTLFITP
ncbi:polysaccharide deacetylase family protein [Roseburia sp. 1XD42-34]|nr:MULTISPECIES: polysaccharide deacetylase family protein [Clostridia]NBJ71370.1 polysaccharide deacetylase family protein [Roseburia sp. 1XD42-34]RKI74459.1 polysaccharide deacetylase family protein [Clostridium sp. 1xD42-85]